MTTNTIENEIWKVEMKDEHTTAYSLQYVVVTRKSDGKEVMCHTNGNVTVDDKKVSM